MRLKKPWCTSFTLYFIICVIRFGSVGIWLPICRDSKINESSLIMNIITYSCALIIPACVSIILSMLKFKNKVSLILLAILMLCLISVTVGFSIFKDSFLDAIICLVISLLLWVIANCDNSEMNDDKFNESIKEGTKSVSKDWK